MTDESIRDRLKRLRRGVQRGSDSDAPSSEMDSSDCGSGLDAKEGVDLDAGLAIARSAQADAESEVRLDVDQEPTTSTTHLDRADKFAADEVPPVAASSSPRSEAFARLLRRARSTTSEPSPLPPRELSFDPPRDLVQSARGTWSRTHHYERAHRHGSFALADVLSISTAKLAECARDERLASIDLERAVFFDTETTGLSGGAGTYVFLVGMGRFTSTGFELWQGFLPHPADEKALLEEVAERIADASAILSFFGKSFDRHRLEDKMRLHGVAPPFEQSIHCDLYYPLRRAHRGKFENCRLKTLERELAQVHRGDDLPGSFAPAAWFDFLGQRPHRLEGVFRHNADDVLSLVALAAHLAR